MWVINDCEVAKDSKCAEIDPVKPIENDRVNSTEIEAIKEANMNKPMKDYTLAEAQEICRSQNTCDGCRFRRDKCELVYPPGTWNLEEKTFSMAERERAEAIKTLFPNAVTLRNIGGTIYALTSSEDVLLKLPEDKFQSIESGCGEYISRITGG